MQRGIRNVVWLAGDVHYAQIAAYDPDGDGVPDFHEAIAGPLSAAPGTPVAPVPLFHSKVFYAEGGFLNFGRVTATTAALIIEIIDAQNRVHYSHRIDARRPS
jgi:alkaline phosphatase D